jgi:long-chain fatty acid transport protein
MKKTIKLAFTAVLVLGTTSAFATNGSAMIGMGAKSRGMAGVGIGMSHGAESTLTNPAMITTIEDTEISFGGTFFMPDVKNSNTLVLPTGSAGSKPTGQTNDSTTATSKADLSVIPEVSIAGKVTNNFYMGVGMWGTAGMGVDYRDAHNSGQMNMVTNLQLMQFGVPLAYKMSNFSIAITPLLQYGSLDVNYVISPHLQNAMYYMQTGSMGGATTPMNISMGVAQDLKFGYNIGVAYTIANVKLGAVYKSKIDMEYNGFHNVVAPMAPGYTNDKLSTPAEIGLGLSYTMQEHTIAFDYKVIQWSKAKGYEDFEWNDQNIIGLGYEYNTKGWGLRVGYNYASSPISEKKVINPQTDKRNSAGLQPGVINTFNLLGFPGIVESHYALGGSYDLTKQTSIDLAYTYAPQVSNTYKNFVGQKITTKHSQTGLTFQLNYIF